MNLVSEGHYNLQNLNRINILLGKNGSGKSTLLKEIETRLLGAQHPGKVNYVTPERGGYLQFNSSVEQNINANERWAQDTKRSNQWGHYKSYSIAQYKRLEILSLREIEQNHELRKDLNYTFDSVIDKINNLLTNIKIVRSLKGDFEIQTKDTNAKIDSEKISSGESELISLAIECLTFEKICIEGQLNWLLLDEPDVHLHPDLQAGFIEFLKLIIGNKFSIIIATHSTAILGALYNYENARFAILSNKSTTSTFKPINDTYKTILPIFGAHPLSNLFNQTPLFLVEGEDEERIYQKAVRVANGSLQVYPCSVDGIGNMAPYESAAKELITGIYDNGKGYSLRDRDVGVDQIADDLPIIKFKLSCRASENLLLSDEVLTRLGTTWADMETSIENWLAGNASHSKIAFMQQFKDGGYSRKNADLKEIRNVLIGISGSSTPWEIAIGEAIGRLASGQIAKDPDENKLCNYLGEKLVNFISP